MHQKKEMVRRAYNKIASDYLALRKEGAEDVKLLDELVKRLPEKSVVLDAGCGGGVPVARLLSRHYKVTGVDISEAQVRLA
jgi:2-polyprenyl-3-methyl-5-hydroxy-6-metoxy-1,4-benzoquinol methylase